jgi:hypothetical protein
MKGLSAETISEMQLRSDQVFPFGIIEQETNKLWVCVYRNNAPVSGLHAGNEKIRDFMG